MKLHLSLKYYIVVEEDEAALDPMAVLSVSGIDLIVRDVLSCNVIHYYMQNIYAGTYSTIKSRHYL